MNEDGERVGREVLSGRGMDRQGEMESRLT